MAKQVVIFLENKPGRLQAVTKTLQENDINMRAMTLQDRENFGLMKILVDKPDQAQRVLTASGFACALKDILAVAIDDHPGGFNRLVSLFPEHNINVKDVYGFVIDSKKQAVICLEVEDALGIKSIIEKQGFKVLADSQIYEL